MRFSEFRNELMAAIDTRSPAEDALRPEAPQSGSGAARTRRGLTEANLSTGLSLIMLATPFVLALLPSAPPGPPRSGNAAHQAYAAAPAAPPVTGATDVATRAVPVIEVKSRREPPSRNETPSARQPAPPASAGPAAPAPAASQAAPRAETPAPAPAAPEQAGPPPQPPDWTETEVATALKSCLKMLAPLIVELDAQPPVRDNTCGLPAPVSIRRIGADRVELQPPIVVNCAMAGALHEWLVKVAQPAARETFGSPIVRLSGVSGYACRNRNGAKDGPISEHAFGNAVDVSSVVLADGRSVNVLKDWGAVRQAAKAPAPEVAAGPPAPAAAPAKRSPKKDMAAHEQGRSALGGPAASAPPSKEAAPEPAKETLFLKRLHAGACGIFGTVLGPEANEAHRDHLHFDLKARRRSGICE